jgi:SNF2 family DNA or RNA helicase
MAALWDDLASKYALTLHATLDRNGEVALLVFPNLAGHRNPKPQAIRQDVARVLETRAVRDFLRHARLRETREDLRWDMPGLNRAIPLSSPLALQSWLSRFWDERRGRTRAPKFIITRLQRATRAEYRCSLRARALRFSSRAVAADVLSALAEFAPDSLTPSTLALSDFLSELGEVVHEAVTADRWVALTSDELALFANYRAVAEATWRQERPARAGDLTRKREERHAFLAAHCVSNGGKSGPQSRDDAADVSKGVRQAVLRGGLHELRPTAPGYVPHLDRGVLLEFVRQAARVREKAPVRTTMNNQHQRHAPTEDDSVANFGALESATAWQTVLGFLREAARERYNRKSPGLRPGLRALAFEARQEESILPEVASWQMPVELPALAPVLFDEGAALAPACLRPAVALGTPDKRALAFVSDPEKATLTLARALAVGAESLRGECLSPAGRIVPYGAEQVVAAFLRTIQVMPGVLGTFHLAAMGKSLHDTRSAALKRAKPLRNMFTNPHRVDDLAGMTTFAPRAFGEKEGLLLDASGFPASATDIPVVIAPPRKEASIVLAFRPREGKSGLLDSILGSADALRRAIEEGPTSKNGLATLGSLELEPVFRFEVDGQSILESDWLKAKKHGEHYVLPDGTSLDAAAYERCLNIYLLRKETLSRYERVTLADVWKASRSEKSKSSDGISPQEYFRTLLVSLEGVESLLGATLVERFREVLRTGELGRPTAVLRPYQEWGVAWLLSRLTLGLGACLADDMGLGKTIQAIETIRGLRAMQGKPPAALADEIVAPSPQGNAKATAPSAPTVVGHTAGAGHSGRVLIVCPKTLLLNWMSEWARFCPEVPIALVDGGPIPADAPVVVTSYSRLRAQAADFAATQWLCVVLDEAHNIKNPGTVLAQAVRGLNTKYRFALTGTPLENHARELWSLVDWMNEGWLGPVSAFEAYTRLARTKSEKDLMLKPVRSLLEPVLLRRRKSDASVALDLPPKIETTLDVELSEEQALLYEMVVQAALGAGQGVESAFARSARYLKAILHCKQICGHPDLFLRAGAVEEEEASREANEGDASLTLELRRRLRERLGVLAGKKASQHERSTKLQAVRERLLSLQEADGGVLIFTQSLGAGAILKHVLAESGVPSWEDVPFLTGALSTQQRTGLVDQFQEACRKRDPSAAPPVLLVSLKAGGLGLNLTGATHVIHFDRWWNPAAEDQATDRAHRIGQTRSVHVHHFRTVGTIEEGIARMIEGKRALASDLLGSTSGEDVGALLKTEEGFLSLVDPDGRFTGHKGVVHGQR